MVHVPTFLSFQVCVIAGYLLSKSPSLIISHIRLSFATFIYHSHPSPSAIIEYKTLRAIEISIKRPNQATLIIIMCIKIIERYAVCKCVYYSHAVDACPAYGRRDHTVRTREVLVGYTCSRHTKARPASSSGNTYADSGYASGSTSRGSSGRNADGSFRR